VNRRTTRTQDDGPGGRTRASDESEIQFLRRRLAEAEETLRAIADGEVDAVVVPGATAPRIFTLAGAETPYRIFLEEMLEGALTLSEDRTILYANRSFARLVQRPVEAVTGRRFTDFMTPASLARSEEILRRTADGRGKGEANLMRADGSSVSVLIAASALPEDGGRRVCMIVTDLSEQKRSEELEAARAALAESNRRLRKAINDLSEAQDRVLQRERLTALGRMASGLARDLNNALTPIVGCTELLLESSTPDALVRADLETVNGAAKDAANVVRRLHEFYRLRDRSERFTPLELNALIGQAVALAQPKWKDAAKAAGLSVHVLSQLEVVPRIIGDESEVREALLNLIHNAVEAMPEGGSITLRTRVVGDRVELSIRDTGVGMTPEVRNRCIEPFFSTKAEGASGLGLSIVHGAVRRHDGEMSIVSEPGRGTEIVLSFPVPSTTVETPAPVVRGRPKGLRALVVDPDSRSRAVIKRYLAADGHAAEAAASPDEALEKLRGGAFDLVVTDHVPPEMNGERLAAAIKADAPAVRVLLLTGFADSRPVDRSTADRVDKRLAKPVSLVDWRRALADACGR
jgi:PAS domain S-box-containing protein